MEQSRVVITGGAGFIGGTAVANFLAQDYAVTVVDDLRAGTRERVPAGAQLEVFDIVDTDRLAHVCRGAVAVVHLAALPSVPFSIEQPHIAHGVNVNGTVSVLEAVRQSGVRRVVFASSSAVYGDYPELPQREALLVAPKNPYALHKYIGEEYLKLWSTLYGIETVSLRFFNVYGPNFDPEGPYAQVIGRFLKQAQRQEPLTITGDGEQTRDFVHVTDVVRAIAAAVTSKMVGKGEVLNIGSGKQTSINALAALISDRVLYVPARLETRHSCADIAKAQAVLGWQPHMVLEEGIKELKEMCAR